MTAIVAGADGRRAGWAARKAPGRFSSCIIFSSLFCVKRDFPGRRPVPTTSWMPAHAPGPPPAFFAAGRSAPADVPVDAKGLRMAIFA
ncbi:MAG: hypothetical protein WA579_01210 [Rhodomicrobium sp.]